MERFEHPECYEPEKNNAYPLCIGKDYPMCEDCQLRADWEPVDLMELNVDTLKLN